MGIIYSSLAATALMSLLLICWPQKDDPYPFFLPRRWMGAAFLLLFVFQPINHLAYDYISLDHLDPANFEKMCLACTGGLAFWWVGWNWGGSSAGQISKASRLEISRKGMAVLVLPAALGVAILLAGIGVSGIIRGNLNDTIAVPQEWLSIFGWLLGALLALGLSALVWGRSAHRRSYQLLGAVALVVYFLVSLRMAARFRTLFLISSVAAPLTNKLSRRKMVVVMASLAILFIAYSYVQRTIRTNFTIGRAAESFEESLNDAGADAEGYDWYAFFVFGGDLDAFENGMQMLRAIPEYHDYLYGSTMVAVLYNPVPRILWPDKPSPSPIDILAKNGFGLGSIPNPNIAVSLIGELYANFGWFGVLLGMTVFGLLSRRIHSHLSSLGTQYALIQLGLFCGFVPLLLRGNFLVMVIYYLSPALWLILARVTSKTVVGDPRG
jgi:hypothetical protein